MIHQVRNPSTLPGHYDPPVGLPESRPTLPEIPRDDAGHLAAAEAKRQRKAAKRDACRCQRCGELRAKRRRQNTAYYDDAQNFAILCEPCQQEADEGWDELWREVHADQRASLSL